MATVSPRLAPTSKELPISPKPKNGSRTPVKRPFASHGTLRLEGATIDGDLVCSAGRFLAGPFLPSKGDPSKFADKNLDAIAASCLKVGSDIFLDNNFEANGNINLISARVGGDLMCDTASLSFPGEEPLVADVIIVEGTTFLRQVKTNGILRFVQADLKQGLYLNGRYFRILLKSSQSWTKAAKPMPPRSNWVVHPAEFLLDTLPLAALFVGRE